MNLLNENGSDFSEEYLLQCGAMFSRIWAAEQICYRIASDLDRLHARGTVFQTKRFNIKRARMACDTIRKELEQGFDERLFWIGRTGEKFNALQQMSTEVLDIVLTFLSREETGDVGQRVIRAIRNFKTDPRICDLDEVLKLYKIQHFDD